MPFDIFLRVLFHQGAWKLAAPSAVAEVLLVKAGLDLAFQAGLAFSVIAYQTACAGILKFLAADTIDSTGCQQF
jgi:hypothetical protein